MLYRVQPPHSHLLFPLSDSLQHMLSLQQQKQLLQKEYEFERNEFRRETEAFGIGRKVKRGDCWFPVTMGRSYYNSLDRLVVEIHRSTDSDIEHNFEYGRSVCFFSQQNSDNLKYLNFSGTISYAEADRMVVVLPNEQALSQLQALENGGVQLNFDETSYKLMNEALDAVISARGNRLAELRDIIRSRKPVSRTENLLHLNLPWLNASQEQAVNDVLAARDVMIVHGPPGTGKTTTLVEAIMEVMRREPQVMVCAQSNMAVDWISEQLADRGVSVLRIGNPSRVTDKMLSFTYERRFESHPDYSTLWSIRRTIRQLYATPRKGRSESFHQKIAHLRERADELELRIRNALFDQSRVVACTLVGSANQLLQGIHFHTLFIDEAAQALEPACWIALRKCDRFVLAGDHCQLPPTIKSNAARYGGLDKTLMETLAETHPEAVRLLTVQYRMNEALMRFSSEWFYEGKLQAAPEVSQRGIMADMDEPLVWVDTAGEDNEGQEDFHEQFIGASYGRINKAEARLTLNTLINYAERIGRQRLLEERIDIGIISPYKAQVQYLRALLKKNAYLRPLRKSITINTVDAFQGQERDVILVSLVRTNEAGEIGFLNDLRRMNVAITRARMKLIILGASTTLCRHKFYKKLYDSCSKLTIQSLRQNEDSAEAHA